MEYLGDEVSEERDNFDPELNLLIKTKSISINQELNVNINFQVNLNTGFLNSPDKDITIKFTPR